MNGPEHYRKAEQLIAASGNDDRNGPSQSLQAAQVHATLALAAAQVDAIPYPPDPVSLPAKYRRESQLAGWSAVTDNESEPNNGTT
jgi:hypothetical protein